MKNRSTLRQTPRVIRGIPCEISSPRVCKAIGRVLESISRSQRDWARVRRRVQAFRYFAPAVETAGTLGQWVVDREEARRLGPQSSRPETWARPEGHFQATGWVSLSRRVARLPWEHLVATVAHECGHVATRESELLKRGGLRLSSDDEWISELCADWHAFRWGFEKQIRAHAPRRSFAHHAVLPGEVITMDLADGPRSWRVDRHFYLRPVSSLVPSGPSRTFAE